MLKLKEDDLDGTVAVSFPVQRTINTTLSPAFLAGAISSVKEAIERGGYAKVLTTFKGVSTGERSGLKVSYEFDKPTDDGVYGQIVKLDRGRIAGAMQAIATNAASLFHLSAARDEVIAVIVDSDTTDDGSLSDVAADAVAQVALFGAVRQMGVVVDAA